MQGRLIAPGSQEERDRARLATARSATDAEDLRELLDMLGLLRSQEDLATLTGPSSIDPGDAYPSRRAGWPPRPSSGTRTRILIDVI